VVIKPGTNPLDLLFASRRAASVVDVLCKQVVKDHVMSSVRRKKGPHELTELILKHDPNASLEMIANVISDWGDLSDDHRFDSQESIDIETAALNGQP
jgi:hypothetical protein